MIGFPDFNPADPVNPVNNSNVFVYFALCFVDIRPLRLWFCRAGTPSRSKALDPMLQLSSHKDLGLGHRVESCAADMRRYYQIFMARSV